MKLLPSGTKGVFDIDLIAGMLLALAIDYALAYIAINVDTTGTLKGRPFGAGSDFDIMAWDDVILFAILISGAVMTKGRTRKIFVYALYFEAFLLVASIIKWKSGVGFF